MIINYSVKLITPALTGQSGVIGKDIDIEYIVERIREYERRIKIIGKWKWRGRGREIRRRREVQ